MYDLHKETISLLKNKITASCFPYIRYISKFFVMLQLQLRVFASIFPKEDDMFPQNQRQYSYGFSDVFKQETDFAINKSC